MAMLTGPEAGEFTWHEISTRVNSADNDDAQLVLPITDEQREAEAPKPKKAAVKKATANAGGADAHRRLVFGHEEVDFFGNRTRAHEGFEDLFDIVQPVTRLFLCLQADAVLGRGVVEQAGGSLDQKIVVAIGVGRIAELL